MSDSAGTADVELALLEAPIPALDLDVVAGALDAQYGLAGRLTALPGECDQNLMLDDGNSRWSVKVAHPLRSASALDMQAAAVEHLSTAAVGFVVPTMRRTVAGSRHGVINGGGERHLLRVMTYLEGEPLRGRPDRKHAGVGALVAAVQTGLRGFFHPAAGRRPLWDARRVDELRPLLAEVRDAEVVELVRSTLDGVVLRDVARLRAQVIHHDLNPDNILVVGDRLAGVIDFGDMVHGPTVMDLAVAAAYHVRDGDHDAVHDIAAEYERFVDLDASEQALLPDLVAVRLCQSIVIGSWRARRHPANRDYLAADVVPAIEALDLLLTRRAKRVRPEALAQRRSEVLAPSVSLRHSEPFEAVSATGAHVTAGDGTVYLDGYNNVFQLGHGDAEVARVVARQTERLNMSTRYLTRRVVELAELLVSVLPEPLDTCLFTTSGSEANDLALRMARAVTGAGGIVHTAFAYHGSTTLTSAISPEERPDASVASFAATVAAPGGAGAAPEAAVDTLQRRGLGVAAAIVDSIFSSDGIHDPAPSYLDELARAVHAAGGLYVADEVQAGLGRVGRRFWGFAAGSAVPDIVTLGKPLGNGYPIGAVVTRRAIAGEFAETEHFFSTFGGNAVGAAVATTVIERTLADGLPERAESLGGSFRRRLHAALGPRHGVVDVRGAGLFTGVELATTPQRGDRHRADAVVEAMRRRGVLIGRTGPAGNVLKIRPPLVIDEADLEHLAMTLVDVLDNG